MNTFNVSHVFHIKKSAQLYILKKFKKKWKSTSVSTTQMNTVTSLMELSPIFFYIYTWNYSWRHDTNIIYFIIIFPTHSTYSFMSLQVAIAVSKKLYEKWVCTVIKG